MTLDHVSTPNEALLDEIGLWAKNVRVLESEPSQLEISRSELHQAMRQARQAGHTLQQIADAAGVTRQRVHQVLNEKGEGQ